MSNPSALPPCPDAETLAAFAEGKLPRKEIAAVVEHLDRCPSCLGFVQAASEEVVEQPAAPTARFKWIALAASILVAIVSVPALRNFRAAPENPLVGLAPRTMRAFEPRLTGGFEYAPYRGPVRSSNTGADPAQLKLSGAAGDLLERANREKSADAQHDAGVALVLIEQPSQAIARLRDATQRDPKNARAWSDLAAAQYAEAVQLGRPSAYPEALSSVDQALRIDGNLAEALFNRALILERLGLTRDARAAWQRYLDVDASSPWANEGRRRLGKLPETTGDSSFKRDLPRLESAGLRGDIGTVDAIVKQYRQQARTYAEAEHLGAWGEHDDARALTIARTIGDALARISDEHLLRDAVAAIDRGDRKTLAQAHALYRRGRIAYSRQQLADGERDLRASAELFARASSPMALVARYFAACARYDRNDYDAAQRELEQLLAPSQNYAALGAQLRWQLALCHMQQDDWSSALPLVEAAERTFRRLDERSNLGFAQTLLADTLINLGRPDDAWTTRIESFRLQSAEGRGDRLPVSLGGAARMELRHGRLESARALLQLEAAADRAANADHLLTNALVRQAVVESSLGDHEAATAHAREAMLVAERLRDPALRERAIVDAEFARGAVLLARDPRAAQDALTRAIDGYTRGGMMHFLPEPHLLRARARLASNDTLLAKEDLERGIAIVERHRVEFAGGLIGTGIFDAGRALFRDAIALAAKTNDAASAFAYAERSRARVGREVITAHELQQRLRGTTTAVLQAMVIDDAIVSIIVTDRDVVLARAPHDPARLYEAIEPLLARATHLIVVADPLLEDVPFAALYDPRTRTHLVERMAVSMALSASSLQRDTHRQRPHALVAMALPSGEQNGTIALPRTARELAELRALYPRAVEARATFADLAMSARSADVLHIAGHTRREPGAGESALRFGNEAVSWKNLTSMTVDGTVVLAACETLRRPRSKQTFALSLGGGFVAAGARDVIGTLDEVHDEDAYALFRTIHHELARGATAAEAVQRAQLAAIASGQEGWRSIAVLTRRITD